MGAVPGEVTVFATCVVEHVRPAIGAAAAELVGGRLVGGACCGQPAWNAGFEADARRVARAALKRLRATSGPIVVPSGSCATMLVEHWPTLFEGTREEAAARDVAARVEDLSVHLLRRGGPDGATCPGAVGFHDGCHGLRELGVHDQPRSLLRGCGATVVEVSSGERCCGFGGTFSVKMPSVSVAMADEKLDEWVAAGVTEVVTSDLSCLLQLDGRARRRGLGLRFRHLAEVLHG